MQLSVRARSQSVIREAPPLTLSKILECPICDTHERDHRSGEALFPAQPDLLRRALRAALPQRHVSADVESEWGRWHTGGTFGVYLSHGGADGIVLSEGDTIMVEETSSKWGSLVIRRRRAREALLGSMWQLVGLLLALLLAALAVWRGSGRAPDTAAGAVAAAKSDAARRAPHERRGRAWRAKLP